LPNQSEQDFARQKNRSCEPFFGLSEQNRVKSGVGWSFYRVRPLALSYSLSVLESRMNTGDFRCTASFCVSPAKPLARDFKSLSVCHSATGTTGKSNQETELPQHSMERRGWDVRAPLDRAQRVGRFESLKQVPEAIREFPVWAGDVA
jgi:hypothetical protein